MKILKDQLKSIFTCMIVAVAMLSFSSCSNTGQGVKEDYNDNTEEIEDAAEEAGDEIEDAADEAGDEIEDATDN